MAAIELPLIMLGLRILERFATQNSVIQIMCLSLGARLCLNLLTLG